MRKIVCILMVVMLMVCCVACSTPTDDPADSSNNNGTQSSETSGNNDPSNNNQNTTGKVTLDAVLGAKASPESDFEITDYGDAVVVSKYLGNDEIVVIPETINGKRVTELGAYIFANDYHPKTKAVRLSNGITTVSTGAFGLNQVLEIFVAGDGLLEIEEGAFQNCLSLSTVMLNDGVKTLGGGCFSSCTNLKEIEIPSSVTEIHHSAFYFPAENFTIVGTAGSAAEAYATKQQISFKSK